MHFAGTLFTTVHIYTHINVLCIDVHTRRETVMANRTYIFLSIFHVLLFLLFFSISHSILNLECNAAARTSVSCLVIHQYELNTAKAYNCCCFPCVTFSPINSCTMHEEFISDSVEFSMLQF